VSGLSQQENRKRFTQAFYEDAEPPASKPDDFRKLFKGNTNDMFCLGIKFTRQALKLYSSFYSSDLIVASPLGLRLIVGNKGDKKRDFDFLSSIEMLVIDQADAIQMQTWDNVDHILKHLNLVPKESHGCDFSRVRPWYLDEQAGRLRQTLVFASYVTPEMNGSFARLCKNIGGKLKVRYSHLGSMANVGMRLRQTFTRIASQDPVSDPDSRFRYFTTVLLPALQRSASYDGTLIVVPTYLDFIRLRNYFDENNSPAWTISEYSSLSEVSRARSLFATGRTKILLYTERLHHFRRYDIKGVKQLLMYGVPENPTFYVEMMRFLIRSNVESGVDTALLKARIIYSKWDSLKLERIVGTQRVGALLHGTTDTYEFY
jgi:U3 small nucleolar RNA-associated protein 25